MAKDPNKLARLFGVENLITPKTLVNETRADIGKKTPLDATNDIRALLDEMNMRVVSQDIIGAIECIKAIQLRVDMINGVAESIRKQIGK